MTELADLFSRDPLDLSNQDISSMVDSLRKQRARFVSGNKSAGAPASRKSANTKKQDEALAVGKNISLDLGDL